VATFEQQRLFDYVRDLQNDDVLERLAELEKHVERLTLRLAEVELRRGPGRPRKQHNAHA
jgi:hypothetical protein